MNTLKRVQKYMTGRKSFLPASLVLSGLSGIVGLMPYIFIWYIIRELLTNSSNFSSKDLSFYAWWALGTAIASIILYFIALMLSHLAAFRAEVNMRKYSMEKIIKMPLGFFNNNTTGRIRKVIDENASTTHGFLAHQLPDLAATIVMPLAVLILMFVFDWRLGLACFVPVIFAFFIMSTMMSEKGMGFLKQYMTSLEEMNTEAIEYVRGIPVVKVFQQTVFSFKNFHKSIMKYKDMVFAHTMMWEKPMSLYTVIINSFVYLLVPVAVIIINSTGDYANTILNLFLYVLVTPIFSQSIMRSMHLMQAFGQTDEAVNRIENLSNAAPLSSPANPKAIKEHNIKFSNVSFCYPESNNKAVDHVSFEIKEGTTTAMVGVSGSGKTTIARMLPRFWDVDEGEVLIGGVNVKDVDLDELMNHISFVFQNTRLFKTTLLENIKYSNPAATMEEVENAVDLAQCREIINKLPDGLNTKIGVEGTYLSGGEQQRIVLARAILKESPIVILDEATAFADPENEHLIQRAFKKLTKNKTVLMIAHRLTSVTSADNILVMEEGRIVEQGTHKELLEREGTYAHMWKEFNQAVNWKVGKEEAHA